MQDGKKRPVGVNKFKPIHAEAEADKIFWLLPNTDSPL